MFPFDGTRDTKTQYLYTPSEIGGAGYITAIRMRQSVETASPVSCPNVTIKMGHSSLTTLTTAFASNVQTGQGAVQTVLDDRNLTIPSGAIGDWIDIPLSVPFYFNGYDNLVVDIERTTKCSSTVETTFQDTTDRRAHSIAADATPGVAEYSSTTATLGRFLPWMQFVFSGGENTVTTTNTNDNSMSLAPGYTGRTQMIILASDINGDGLITGMALSPNSTTHATDTTVISGMTVRIAHIPSTAITLSTDFTANYDGNEPTTVTRDLSYTVPHLQSSPIWIPFNNSDFIYDGASNLLIDISCTVSAGSYSVDYKDVATDRVAYATDPAATTALDARARAFQPVLRFHGGTLDVISDSTQSSNKIFNTTLSGIMGLYHASELGTSGTITSVYCRLSDAASTAASYDRFRLIIGHSSGTRLVTTPADNFIGQHSAVNGTVSVPAGLIAGDWIEIPLAAPFEYNGTDNLVVWMGTYAASGAGVKHGCRLSSAQSQYTENLAYGLPGNSAVSAPVNQKLDLRLKIVK